MAKVTVDWQSNISPPLVKIVFDIKLLNSVNKSFLNKDSMIDIVMTVTIEKAQED